MKLATILESFVSNLTNLKSDDLEDLFNKEYDSPIKVEYSAFQRLEKTTDAVYLIVSYDENEEEYLINDMKVVSKNGNLKMVDHSPIPLETARNLTGAKQLVSKMCKK